MCHYDMADVTFYPLDMRIYRRDHEYVFYVCLTFFALLRKELAVTAWHYSPAQQQKFSSESQAPHSH